MDKVYKGIARKEITYQVVVLAKNKSAAIKKIREGDVQTFKMTEEPKGFILSGNGNRSVEEV